jgi:hypothetical protein
MAYQRFITIYQEGFFRQRTILVDRETGVHYFHSSVGPSGGMTPLLDDQGKPVISKAVLYK